MGILGSVFDAFFDGLAIDVLRNSNKSTSSKRSGEKSSPSSLKAWASQFDTTIEKDFTEYDWFDFYPSNNCNDVPRLHPKAFLESYSGYDPTSEYLRLEKAALLSPYSMKAQCDFIEYCFNLIDLLIDVTSENYELDYDSQYAPSLPTFQTQLYEKIHRSIYNILTQKDNSLGGEAQECTMCILDAEVYLYKGQLVKCLKRYYKALSYNVISSSSYGFNKWYSLECAVLSNVAGLYNFAGLSERSLWLFNKFDDCIAERKSACRDLMNGCIKGSESGKDIWAAIIKSLNNPTNLGFHWNYYAKGLDKLGELYNIGRKNDEKGWPIDLTFEEGSLFDYCLKERGEQWAEEQKKELRHYILNQE